MRGLLRFSAASMRTPQICSQQGPTPRYMCPSEESAVEGETAQVVGGDSTCMAWNPTADPFVFATGSHGGIVRVWTAVGCLPRFFPCALWSWPPPTLREVPIELREFGHRRCTLQGTRTGSDRRGSRGRGLEIVRLRKLAHVTQGRGAPRSIRLPMILFALFWFHFVRDTLQISTFHFQYLSARFSCW